MAHHTLPVQRPLCLLVLLGMTLTASAPALAQDKPRMVVVFEAADNIIDKRLGRDLQETLLSALFDEGERYELVGAEALAHLGEFSSHEALVSCLDDADCVAALRQEHAVDVLIRGDIKVDEGVYALRLQFFEQGQEPKVLAWATLRADGLDPVLETLFAQASDLNFPTNTLRTVTERDAPPETQGDVEVSTASIVGYSLMGAALVSLGAGLYFDLSADAAHDDLVGQPNPETAPNQWDDVEQRANLSNVFYAGALSVGVVGASIVAYELLMPPVEVRDAPTTRIAPLVEPSSWGVVLDTRF